MGHTKREYHPIANIFPLMREEDLAEMMESIKRSGQREPAVLLEGKILEGRNRDICCERLGIELITRDYDPAKDGDSPLRFAMDVNLERRHLTTGQKAAAARDALPFFEEEAKQRQQATQFKTTPKPPKPTETPAQPVEAATPTTDTSLAPAASGAPVETQTGRAAAAAAEEFGVSTAAVQTASQIAKEDPETFEEVKKGTISLNAGAEKAKAKREEKKVAEAAEDPELAKTRTDRRALVAKVMGEEFADAFEAGTLLKTKEEVSDFLVLAEDEKPTMAKQIKELLIRGWKVKKAVKFYTSGVDRSDTVADLILHCLTAAKPGTFKCMVDEFEITVKRKNSAEPQPQSPSENP